MRKKGLILALDVEPGHAKAMIRELRDHIEIFKIGHRLFTALGPQVVQWVHDAGRKVFLDLKFHDIPLTVAEACRNAVRMKVWGLTVHTSGGFDMMREAQKSITEESRRLKIVKPLVFGVTVLTSMSESDLMTVGVNASPKAQVKRLALLAKKSGLDALVASGQEIEMLRKMVGERMILGIPGIRLVDAGKKDDQKRVMTPEKAISLGADYVIIGRPILEAKNKIETIHKIARAIL